MTVSLIERLCNLCGIQKDISAFHKRSSSKTGYRSQCIACEKEYAETNREKLLTKRKYKRSNNLEYNAYQRRYTTTLRGRASRILAGAKRRAVSKQLDFEITIDFIMDRLKVGLCEQTGIRFVIGENYHCLAPSLDRKESTKGYTLDNCQVVCVAYNMGKQHMTDDEYKNFILEAASNILK